jgi:hypothetical protein
LNINFIPDLPKDFDKADKLLKFGGTTMGIFKINGGKLQVAYCHRQWQEEAFPSYQVSGPLPIKNLDINAISNVLEGMALLSEKNAKAAKAKIYAMVAGRGLVFRLFAERKIINDFLKPVEHGRFEGQVVIGDKTYRLLVEETKKILGNNLQVAFVSKDLQIIGW